MTETDLPVLIAGGGIGGLATALALAKRGIASEVLEKRGDFEEAGAGIQIGPNGTRILADLGVAQGLEAQVGRPEALSVRDGASGAELARMPLGDWIAARHGSPYWVAHRQDLHVALLDTARASPLVGIRTDFEVDAVTQDEAGVRVASARGATLSGRALIAADGRRSRLRARLFEDGPPVTTGACACRTVIAMDRLEQGFWRSSTGIWLARDAHVVHYPVRAGRELAIVLIAKDPVDRGQGASEVWSGEVASAWIGLQAGSFAKELREILGRAPNWRRWSLVKQSTQKTWTHGRVALLGDAAHLVMPFLAQGGVLALEDAVVLAEALAKPTSAVPEALAEYERRRRPRAQRVAAAAERNGQVYHLSGISAVARNAVLRFTPPERLIGRYDWLYGWKIDGNGV